MRGRRTRPVLIAAVLTLCAAACHQHGTTVRKESSTPRGRDGFYHKVKEGETLSGIIRAYGADEKEVLRFNRIRHPDRIRAGQRIFIPGAKEARKPGRVEKPPSAAVEGPGHVRFIWPVRGQLTSRFGIRDGRKHNGIDIAAPEGTSVCAAAAGTVVYSDDKIRGFGNLIILLHEAGLKTIYAHNRENLVRVNEKVKQGQVIARVGSTGHSSGHHLHFEIRKGTAAVDPLAYLPK